MKKINIYKALDKLEEQARDKSESDKPFRIVWLKDGELSPPDADRDRHTMYVEVLPPCTQRA